MTNKGRMITLIGTDGFRFGAYRVGPAGPAKGGLVLAMEIFGVNTHIKAVADGFAQAGYVVIAPALFERAERDFETGYAEADLARARTVLAATMYHHTQGDIQAAVDALHAESLARVHVTGYCYGGSVAWLAACRCTGLTSAVGFYGRHIIEFVGETPRCPTMLHFGRRDASIPMEWVEQIRAAHKDVTVHVYDAEHGFNCDQRASYEPASAALARTRTLAHFEAAR